MLDLLITLTPVVGAYVAGRAHGQARHKAFLARGFRHLASVSPPGIPADAPIVSANQVIRAFGSEAPR